MTESFKIQNRTNTAITVQTEPSGTFVLLEPAEIVNVVFVEGKIREGMLVLILDDAIVIDDQTSAQTVDLVIE